MFNSLTTHSDDAIEYVSIDTPDEESQVDALEQLIALYDQWRVNRFEVDEINRFNAIKDAVNEYEKTFTRILGVEL